MIKHSPKILASEKKATTKGDNMFLDFSDETELCSFTSSDPHLASSQAAQKSLLTAC